MTNRAKQAIIKNRDRFLGNVVRLLEQSQQSVDHINSELNTLKQQQEELRLQQIALNNSLSNQIHNTGIIQIADNEILVKLFNGLKIYLDTRDIAVVPHMALDGIWEPQITNAWLALVKPADTIFDIGANFGYFGLLAAHKTDKKNSKVILIEANPHLISYINKTLSLNWYNEQAVVENFAVSDTTGKAVLNILKDYIGSSSMQTVEELDTYMHSKMQLELAESITVKAQDLDSYCKQHNIESIDLIKMDIEGYEDKAYQGMRQIVSSSPNITMFIEFTKEGYANPRRFYDQMLEDFGYVYLIDAQGNLVKPKKNDYDFVIGGADDWVMPVFSKQNRLA